MNMAESDITRLWTFADGTTAPDAPSPVSDVQVNAFEQRFGVKLPSALIELYRQQNGGFSERHLAAFWSIERGSNTDITSLQVLVTDYHEDADLETEWAQRLGDLTRIVVILGDGHFYFVLNYNDMRDGEPSVWYMADCVTRSTSKTFANWLFSDGGAA